jgi:predicted NACHT family NTPase
MAGREGRALKLSAQGLKQAKQALLNFESQADLAAQLAMSRTTVTNFFAGRPVQRAKFQQICKKLKLNWREVADLPKDVVSAADEQEQNKGDDIDALVQKVRALCRDKIQHQCGTMQLLDVSHPVDLDNLYVDVNILEDIPSQRWERIADRQQDFDPTADNFERFYLGKVRQPRVPGLEAAEKNLKLMVLGKPGSGKTTFLKHLAIECNKGKFQADRVPIFIGLKRFTDNARNNLVGATQGLSLQEYISQELLSRDVAATDIEKLLKYGKALILLDGLDEVSEQDSEAVRQQIIWLSERYFQNQFALTCRTQAQKYRFEGFTYVEVADFKFRQIEAFAKKWFVAVARNTQEKGLARAAEFIEKLKQPENTRVRELAVTPILLSLTCLVFNYLEYLPTSRAKLYDQGLNILLVRWDEDKGVQRDEVYRNLKLPHKIKLLSQVAAITFERGEYFFEQDTIQRLIADYLCTLPGAQTDPDLLQIDSESVLKSIEVQNGLLIERAREIYSFSHLTFQEYFTAKKIVDSFGIQALDNLSSRIADKRWREVILLTSEMLSNAES